MTGWHICDNDCVDETLNKIYLKCTNCSGKYFVMCLYKYYEEFKRIIVATKLLNVNTKEIEHHKTVHKTLCDILQGTILFMCKTCKHSIDKLKTDYLNAKDELENVQKQLKEAANEAFIAPDNKWKEEFMYDLQSEVVTASNELITKRIKVLNDEDNVIDFSNLKLPEITSDKLMKEESEESCVYSVHVAKFNKDMKESEIVSHILKNTKLNEDSFKVTQLISANKKKAQLYTSFKISTLKYDVQ